MQTIAPSSVAPSRDQSNGFSSNPVTSLLVSQKYFPTMVAGEATVTFS